MCVHMQEGVFTLELEYVLYTLRYVVMCGQREKLRKTGKEVDMSTSIFTCELWCANCADWKISNLDMEIDGN